MINPYQMKKNIALFIVGIFTAIPMFVGLMMYDLITASLLMFFGLIASMLIANQLLKTPFSLMLEGKGLLAFDLNSTGIIRAFIVSLDNPYLKGKIGKEDVSDVFDREAVLDLEPPRKLKKEDTPCIVEEEGKMKFEINYEQFNKNRFRMLHYPVLIYNSHLKSFIDKETVSTMEKETFANHPIIFLNRKVESLTNVLTHFSRQVIELSKPKDSLWGNSVIRTIVIFIIILAVGIGGYLLLKPMMGGGGSNPLAVAAGAMNAIQPR